MDIFLLGVHFADQKSRRIHFEAQRDKEGVVCNRCRSTEHYWLQNKWNYQCKYGTARISLRSGTILESSKLSFMIWYKTIFLLSIKQSIWSNLLYLQTKGSLTLILQIMQNYISLKIKLENHQRNP